MKVPCTTTSLHRREMHVGTKGAFEKTALSLYASLSLYGCAPDQF